MCQDWTTDASEGLRDSRGRKVGRVEDGGSIVEFRSSAGQVRDHTGRVCVGQVHSLMGTRTRVVSGME